MKPHDIVQALDAAVITKTRANGEIFTILKDGHDQWMIDIVREAHGGMLPDDTRYTMIREVVSMLADMDPDAWDDDAEGVWGAQHETCDGLVDVYTAALTAWLASHLDRVGYVTDAAREYGGQTDDVTRQIAMGQFAEYEEIYGSIVQSVLALAEETTEDDETEGEGT